MNQSVESGLRPAELILGPMVRYIDARSATVWVETDRECEVEVLGHRERTFRVGDAHYAIVPVAGLEPGTSTTYEVKLDGTTCWPPPGSEFPASRIQTLPDAGPVTVLWGSCRVTAPHHPPYTLDQEDDARGCGVDALFALVQRLVTLPPEEWPRLMLQIGDQVYADEVSPFTKVFLATRRDTTRPPGEEVIDLTEYAALYREAFSQPSIRWLLSTVPTAMIFDDHDVHDDWNTSESWAADMHRTDWWQERITAALVSYWLYQHLGNLSPDELANDPLYARVRASDNGEAVLREFATSADQQRGGSLWSYSRQIAGTKLIVLDSREGRVLEAGRREMMDEGEWSWLREQLAGDHEHVLIASTLPILLAPTLHYVEAWNEAVCAGAWGSAAARIGERIRRGLDLEHWAAFQTSFHRIIGLLTEVASGHFGHAPASIVMLGGDVHQAYLETVGFPDGVAAESKVYQAVCSPFRNQLGRRERTMLRIARRSKAIGRLARGLAHAAGVRDPEVDWRVLQQPTWRNQLAWLRIDGRSLELVIESTTASPAPALEVTLRHQLGEDHSSSSRSR